ncbi:Methyltransferase domain-containing protein [Clostridium sp. DSM 8431]|uniref:class I SAM-dependent methyltransferase n=1 Tax=Clostridium sp. DSM 8431 TaxID=1761781 RepID=UPI0008EFF16E|nr:SAM-dependent methyltransferase [Clostridium sp. DSM 8431]SFU84350.1 Methyltransferase domain-containing protein [Clostridium sp. DSM 8431]
MDDLIKNIDIVCSEKILKVVISNKINSNIEYNKITFLLKDNGKKEFYQIEKFTEKQVFHENIEVSNLKGKILEAVEGKYKQLSAWSEDSVFDMKISKKGKVHLSTKKSDNSKLQKKTSHNKVKNYILQEGMIIEPLIDLGVFTKEGKVVNSKYDKYKQINRFVEIIDDEVKKKDYKDLTILDFGCGKSYLTFVLYYYFTEIRNIKVNMIGLDLKADVIKKCNEIAKKYNYENLHFEMGDVNGYKHSGKVDMVITLHACNTATDYALYNAIKWDTEMIFSVPCCQHELNSQIETDDLSILTRYGIIKERTAALMTDAVRANLLECVGYKTQLIEFIDFAHSPKNILIRASKNKISKERKAKYLTEVENLMKQFNLKPTLHKLLKEDSYI